MKQSWTREYTKTDISDYLGEFPELDPNWNYELTLEGPKGQRQIGDDGIYQDEKYGIALRASNASNSWEGTRVLGGRIALISFYTTNNFYFFKDAVFCLQLQSSNKLSHALPRRWDRSLLKSTYEWAKNRGYRRIIIQAAKNHYRFNFPPESDVKLGDWQLRLKMRYDVTSKRLGFKRNFQTSNFEMIL